VSARKETDKSRVPVQDKVGFGPDNLSSSAILDLQGRFKVTPGDPVEDVRRARELMGTERPERAEFE
jgi:hypothetical protein